MYDRYSQSPELKAKGFHEEQDKLNHFVSSVEELIDYSFCSIFCVV